MSSDPYSSRVRALFGSPVHARELDGPHRCFVDDQGIRLELSATLDGHAIREMAFRAYGCPHLIAAAEAACAELEGRDAVELLEFPASDLMQSLSVPVEKTGRILVLEDAIRSLGRVITETE